MAVSKGTIRLIKPQDVRRMLARVINELLLEEPPTIDRARVIATLSNSIIKAMEVGELDERIRAIEEQLGANGG
ncbi:hypothetical protein SAMN05444673_0441 [Bacillus sp. OV166]|uniref:hypothetical protein n=1 Tax=Bacillus sp. OV166 TaxID=1882763 RepID=UPI000A2AE096|nr:hypothetical protein [Bacillus sp. OV166]SMQ60928.1 hypothetical protein SAMN05444673_0441 [Bacillus sp. OV166]